jgi:CMP-N-acetylneuraminic acid synthetase
MFTVAVVPCRAGSERVPRKNVRDFAGRRGGLTALKLTQLKACRHLDRIVVNTDDDDVARIAREIEATVDGPGIVIVRRPPVLATSAARTDDVITHVAETTPGDLLLWTHVTSPFVDTALYDRAVTRFRSLAPDDHDSLMSVSRLQEFIWADGRPANYDRNIAKWPRTQDLPAWAVVTSGIFLCPRLTMLRTGDRIGDRPYLFEVDRIAALDVDWPDDFALAEHVYLARHENATGRVKPATTYDAA